MRGVVEIVESPVGVFRPPELPFSLGDSHFLAVVVDSVSKIQSPQLLHLSKHTT